MAPPDTGARHGERFGAFIGKQLVLESECD
jgi:hypothetical protein